MNHVYLIGRITKDPELKITASGQAVCSFAIAVDNPGKDLEGNKRMPTFVPCVAWAKTAENIAKFNKKGSQIAVVGKITFKTYTRKETGTQTRYTEVQVDRVEFLQGGKTPDDVNDMEQIYYEDGAEEIVGEQA